KRAQSRWDALLAGKWETAYSFSTPAYRAAIDVDGFAKRQGGQGGWTGAEVRSVECKAEDICEATVRIQARALMGRGFKAVRTDYTERWVREDGRWWLYQRF